MKSSAVLAVAAALAGAVSAQSTRYCDPLTTICYSSFTGADISFRVAIPEVAAAPFDVILQIVAPNSIGWAAVAWGGRMTYNPLAVGWPNGNETVISSREAVAFNVPNAYPAAEYRLLRGSGVNSTHWTLTTVCRGCSTWLNGDNTPGSLNPTGNSRLSWAKSNTAVLEPSNNASLFTVHDIHGAVDHNLSLGRLPNFADLVQRNLLTPSEPDPEPTTTTTPTTTPTPTPGEPQEPSPAPPTSCPNVPANQFDIVPAPGWRATKIAGGLTLPRAVVVDPLDNLLVLQNGVGVTHHTLAADGCIASSRTLIAQRNLNHGLWLSPDGRTLYASTVDAVYSWAYDAAAATAGSQRTLVTGMNSGGHITRTLLVPPNRADLLVVSRGSDGNLDMPTGVQATSRAAVKVFDLAAVPSGGYNYVTQGHFAGWGLRNEVGLAADPAGMLWGLENSADDLVRTVDGRTTDIHHDNPAEELNFLGDPAVPNDRWYGYPTCFTVWNPGQFPAGDAALGVGAQFLQAPNGTFTDATCEQRSEPPRLSMKAHSAPLDGKFSRDGSEMYVSFHGSWNTNAPTGFKVVAIPFRREGDAYEPVAERGSVDGYHDLLGMRSTQGCNSFNCFRPCGLAVDRRGWVLVTSDSAMGGELFVLGRV